MMHLMLCIFHICLFKSLSCFLLKPFAGTSGKIIHCAFATYVLNYMMGSMLLQEIEVLAILQMDLLMVGYEPYDSK